MPLDPQVLFEETKCYACYGFSAPELIKLGLLNRIATVAAADGGGGGGGGASVWGSITGTLSNQTDLNTALNAKTDLYSLLFFNSAITPISSSTFYLGQNGTSSLAVQQNYTLVQVPIPVAGTVIAVALKYTNETVNATAGAVTVLLNKNNGTTVALAPTISFTGPPDNTLWTGLAMAVAAGDFLALQFNTPAWATPSVNTRLAATIVIQKT